MARPAIGRPSRLMSLTMANPSKLQIADAVRGERSHVLSIPTTFKFVSEAREHPSLVPIVRGESEQQYVDQHAGLETFLETTAEQLVRYFGSAVRARLRLVRFPDSDYERLYLLVGGADPTRDAGALDRLEDEWWLDALSESRFDLSMGIDYGGAR